MKCSRKIGVLGDFGVGKTSMIRRYVHSLFDENYKATLGVNCYTQDIELLHPSTGAKREVRGVIWDIEGGQQRISMVDTYVIGCQAALFVADLTRPSTLDILEEYEQRLRRVSPGCPIMVALNKMDLFDETPDAPNTLRQAEQIAKSISAGFMTTSAATGSQVPEAFSSLVAQSLI